MYYKIQDLYTWLGNRQQWAAFCSWALHVVVRLPLVYQRSIFTILCISPIFLVAYTIYMSCGNQSTSLHPATIVFYCLICIPHLLLLMVALPYSLWYCIQHPFDGCCKEEEVIEGEVLMLRREHKVGGYVLMKGTSYLL